MQKSRSFKPEKPTSIHYISCSSIRSSVAKGCRSAKETGSLVVMWNWGFQLGGYPRGKLINSSAAAVGCAVSNCCSVLLSIQSYSLFHLFFSCMYPDPFAFSRFFVTSVFFFLSSQCALAYCKYTRPFLNLFCCCWVVFFSLFLLVQ